MTDRIPTTEFRVPPVPTGAPVDVARWALDVHHRIADARATYTLADDVDAEIEQARALALASTSALVSIATSLDRIVDELCDTKVELAEVVPLRTAHPPVAATTPGVAGPDGDCLCICHRSSAFVYHALSEPCCDRPGWKAATDAAEARATPPRSAWREGRHRPVHRADDEPRVEPVGDGFPVEGGVR